MATFDDVRTIALALPEAEELLTWETDITFRVRGKIFAMGGEGATAASIKATPTMQADLIERDPETFHPSAYVGRFGWVTADLGRVADDLLRNLIEEAWRQTAPKRLAATYPRTDSETGPPAADAEAGSTGADAS